MNAGTVVTEIIVDVFVMLVEEVSVVLRIIVVKMLVLVTVASEVKVCVCMIDVVKVAVA